MRIILKSLAGTKTETVLFCHAIIARSCVALRATRTNRPRVAGAGVTNDNCGRRLARSHGGKRFATILADPPWQFQNKTGKVAPEHRRLARYATLSLEEIKNLPVDKIAANVAHLYLWVPNALLPQGLDVMQAWGFQYKSNVVWHKVRKDGGSDGRGVGFYFRNVTELDSLWRARKEGAHSGSRSSPGQSFGYAQARAQQKAR